MPLITTDSFPDTTSPPSHGPFPPVRRQSQHSGLAQSAIMSRASSRNSVDANMYPPPPPRDKRNGSDDISAFLAKHAEKLRDSLSREMPPPGKPLPQSPFPTSAGGFPGKIPIREGFGHAASDTPIPTAPNSPKMYNTLPTVASTITSQGPVQSHSQANAHSSPPLRQNSGATTPRARPTTLDIPGLTKSKVSPDGRIAQRDVGSKLVIVMVGLPARGKSYITKKLARYLNWLQHDTKIFNVGERRRVAASGPKSPLRMRSGINSYFSIPKPTSLAAQLNAPDVAGSVWAAGATPVDEKDEFRLPVPIMQQEPGSYLSPDASRLNPELKTPNLEARFPDLIRPSTPEETDDTKAMEQSAEFFNPENKKAALIREQAAMDTLNDLLNYILNGNGSVGILDATNSTLQRRKSVMEHIRERAGPDLNVLFLESLCEDEKLLESNMRLKLSGPDYKDKDPVSSLVDFKKRVAIYKKAYVPLGDYEEKNNMSYIQMIDVGRKIISHQIHGFLSSQANYYLLNFNLAPRQIWITRHGESIDNITGKIGGDSDLSPAGIRYAHALAKFIAYQRDMWDEHQLVKAKKTHFPPQSGDISPPNPHYEPSPEDEPQQKNFCVWTSMLKRSVQTAQFFDEEDFDTKQMRMLDELNAGKMESMTYADIRARYPDEYEVRKSDKLHYRYPGPGGEGYLDIINRLRPVIVELERMTDHVLLVGHRSVARVLLAYFKGLSRDEVAELDVPLGLLYCLEPKPYGVDFKAYSYDSRKEWFEYMPKFELRRAPADAP
ncbi:MAG: hypothetical protein M1821_003288 [Bathelium mastoideum]|nr:MAG: hypothetical protein M1821_003288 [Bathelium mastoideum]